jgi:hypothetical protein
MDKAASTKTLTRLAKKVFGDVKEVPQIVHEGRKALYKNEGTHSIVLWPFLTALRKLKGKEKINNALYNSYTRKLKNADERLGRALAQHGPSQKLFRIKEQVPTKKKIKGLPASVEHETYAASAPVTKASRIGGPMALGYLASEKLGSDSGVTVANEEAKTLMKQAADRIELFERHNEAIKLAFAMVEKGKCPAFESFEEFQTKVALLEEKNLEAVKEALEMDAELELGKIASEQSMPVPGIAGATMQFFHKLSE